MYIFIRSYLLKNVLERGRIDTGKKKLAISGETRVFLLKVKENGQFHEIFVK